MFPVEIEFVHVTNGESLLSDSRQRLQSNPDGMDAAGATRQPGVDLAF